VNTLAKLSPATRHNMIFMMLGGLLFWACLASLLPVLPTYVKDSGASDHEVGIIMGAFAVGLLAFRTKMGQLIETRGRKAVLLLGIAVAAIAPLGYALTDSIPFLLAIRVFHGISIAAFTTSYSTLVADLSPPENRGELIGYMSLVNPIGMAIGPALGGYLAPAIGNQKFFLVCSSLAAASFLFSSLVRAAPLIEFHPTDKHQTPLTSWQLVSNDRFRIPTFTMFSVGLAFGVLSVYLPLFVKEMHLNMNVGLFYTMAAVASFSTRIFAGKASDRFGRGLFITFGLVCYLVSMVMLWFAQDVPTILAAGFVEGLGGGTLLPIVIALITDRCQPHERPRVYSLCIGGFDLGIFMAGPCVGFMAAWVGYRGLFAIAALVTFVATIVFTTLSSKNLPYSLRFALGRGRDLYALPKAST
jgi:MFS family permease